MGLLLGVLAAVDGSVVIAELGLESLRYLRLYLLACQTGGSGAALLFRVFAGGSFTCSST